MVKNKNKDLKSNKEKKSRKIIFWWWFGGGLAFLSLLVGFLFTNPINNQGSNQSSSSVASSTLQNEVLSISVESLPYRLEFTNLEGIKTAGGKLRVSYSNGSSALIDMSDDMVDYSSLNFATTGNKTVTLRFGGKTITYNINVSDYYIKSTSINTGVSSLNLFVNGEYQVKTNVLPASATNRGVRYTSTNPNIVTVDQNGVIRAVGIGEAQIIVSNDDNLSTSILIKVESGTDLITITELKDLVDALTLRVSNLSSQDYTSDNFNLIQSLYNNFLNNAYLLNNRKEVLELFNKTTLDIISVPRIVNVAPAPVANPTVFDIDFGQTLTYDLSSLQSFYFDFNSLIEDDATLNTSLGLNLQSSIDSYATNLFSFTTGQSVTPFGLFTEASEGDPMLFVFNEDPELITNKTLFQQYLVAANGNYTLSYGDLLFSDLFVSSSPNQLPQVLGSENSLILLENLQPNTKYYVIVIDYEGVAESIGKLHLKAKNVNNFLVADGWIPVSTAAELNQIRETANSNLTFSGLTFTFNSTLSNNNNALRRKYFLTQDIDLADYPNWDTIAKNNPFRGSFEGNGFSIKNLTINSTTQNSGLFGQLEDSTIKNLTLLNVDITSTQGFTGSLAGTATKVVIENIYVDKEVDKLHRINGTGLVGGLIGSVNNSDQSLNVEIKDFENKLVIVGTNNVGGIFGLFEGNLRLLNVSNTAQINGNDNVAGLIGGKNSGTLFIDRASNTALIVSNVDASVSVGGLIGKIDFSHSSPIIIMNSFNTGQIFSKRGAPDVNNKGIGGLIGNGYNLRMFNSYNTGTIGGTYLGEESAGARMGGLVGVLYQSTIESSYNLGTIGGNTLASFRGGITSQASFNTYTNVYNAGEISGNNELGGIAANETQSLYTNVFNYGTIVKLGTNYVGAISGYSGNTTYRNAKFLNTTFTSATSIGGAGSGSNEPGTQAITSANFTTLSSFNGFSIDDQDESNSIWYLDTANDSNYLYPKLRIQTYNNSRIHLVADLIAPVGRPDPSVMPNIVSSVGFLNEYGNIDVRIPNNLSAAVELNLHTGELFDFVVTGVDSNKVSVSNVNSITKKLTIDVSSISNATTTPGGILTFDVDIEDNIDSFTYSFRIIADNIAPTISSGTINTFNVSDTALDIGWVKATDNVTSEQNLTYYVYRSLSNNLGSIPNIKLNGTLLNPNGTFNINNFNITDLTASTTYFFNVIVVDEVGNERMYTTKSQATAAPGTITNITSFSAIANIDAGNVGSINYDDAEEVIAALPVRVSGAPSVNVTVLTWVDTDSYDPSVAGSYTFTATLGTLPNGFTNTNSLTATVEVVVSAATPTDTTAPTASNGKAVSWANPTVEQLTLRWNTASDDVTSQNNLRYYVIQSSVDNLQGQFVLADVGTQASPLNDRFVYNVGGTLGSDLTTSGQPNEVQIIILNLSPSSVYYFTIIVVDEAGNELKYFDVETITQTP